TVALVGNPNSGKTSLFNALTGLNFKVSNFPGTTVERKTGYCKLSENVSAQIIDLPGTYSLYPKSADELVTYDLLRNKSEINFPDLVLFIADSSNLKRNLLLMSQVADLGVPVILALNMVDLAEKRGIFYDAEILSNALKIPVLSINARKRNGVNEIKNILLEEHQGNKNKYFTIDFLDTHFLDEVTELTDKKNHYAGLQYAINAANFNTPKTKQIKLLFEKYHFDSKLFQEKEILERYHIIDNAVRLSRSQKTGSFAKSFSNKIDKILTHHFGGLSLFLLMMFLVFQAIFSLSTYPMEWVGIIFLKSSQYIENSLPAGVLNDLIVHGILAGLSGVMVFLPQIIILFAFIAVLEDIGYMARVGFIMDRIMRPFGLNGKSIVPLISGMACAVPSIMASRSIENKKERLITILVTPLMSCSARLPVYTLLISMLVPDDAQWGPFNMKGIVLMFMYFIGFGAALFSAFIFKFFVKSETKDYFLMELPSYKLPVFSNILITLYEKGKAFVWGAGKIIVAVSVILWALASFGPREKMHSIDQKYSSINSITLASPINDSLLAKRSSEKLQASYAGEFGRWIEPAIRPLGFDWKIGIAILTSLAAREVFVGTMSTIYSVGGDIGDLNTIRHKMTSEINPETGKPVFSIAAVLSLLIFYAFALQCMSTVSIVRSETKSWRWALIQFVYMTALAYLSSLAVFNIFS
ncbi:MAG: ferrous iron transport protein B, partial [Bacteroidota bacterium]